MSAVPLLFYFLSWFANRGFPAFEIKADEIGARAGTPEALVRSLVKLAIIQVAFKPVAKSEAQSDALQKEIIDINNIGLRYAQQMREMLANVDPQRVRIWLERNEEQNPSPFHPTLAARAKALGVNLDDAIVGAVEDTKHRESSFLDEIASVEEELTILQRTPQPRERVVDISARERVMSDL